jgi:hypothetical protein
MAILWLYYGYKLPIITIVPGGYIIAINMTFVKRVAGQNFFDIAWHYKAYQFLDKCMPLVV